MKKNNEILSSSLAMSHSISRGGRASYSHILAAAKNMMGPENSSNNFSKEKINGRYVSHSLSEPKIPKLSSAISACISKIQRSEIEDKTTREKVAVFCSLFNVFHEEMRARYELLPEAEGKLYEKTLEAFHVGFKLISFFLEKENSSKTLEKSLFQPLSTHSPKNLKAPEKLAPPPPSRPRKEVSRRENELELENTKLEMRISQLISQLKELEEEQALGYLQKEKEELFDSKKSLQQQFDNLRETYESTTSQSKISILNLKSSLQKAEKELKTLEKNYEKAKFRLEELEVQNAHYKENIVIYREVALMEQEELNSISHQFSENKQLLARFKERAASLQSRLDNLLNANPDQMEIPSELSKADKDILMPLRTALMESSVFIKKLTKKEEISNFSHKDETVRLMVSRPSFSLLIENKMKSYMNQTPENPNKVSLLFLSTLRAILDSKFNECLLYRENPKGISKFVDFAYSWLGAFEVNSKSRKVQSVDNSGSADDVRAMFLVDLSNPRLERLWECVNFKEFFKEEFPHDELFFFLVCRNQLFKGPQLSHLNASFDLIHYVHLEYAEEILKTILERYDKAQILFAISKLKEKSKRKGVNNFVDSAFVLRILLEYYKSEKQIRLGMIRDLFYTQPTVEINGKQCIQFHSFKKIIDANFPTITDLEKAELYRESFSLGEGSVNAESFYTASSENGFFIKVLKIPTPKKFPLELSSDRSKIIPDSSVGMAATILLDNLKDNFNILAYSSTKLSELGLEEISKEWKILQNTYSSLFQISKLDFKYEGIFDFTHRVNELWAKVLNVTMVNLHSQGEIEDVKLVQNYVRKWDLNFEVFKMASDDEAMNLIEQNTKAKKLQAFIKKRISKWYMLMNQIFTSKLKSTLGNKLKT